jgi:hypothetical protein
VSLPIDFVSTLTGIVSGPAVFDKFKARWNDPEFVASFARRFPEDPLEIVKRMEKIDMRAQWWRKARRVLMKIAVGVLLALATFRQFRIHSREARLQSAAFILAMAAIWALQMLDKEREKYREPKYWLDRVEFFKNEYTRLGQNIRIDLWSSVALCLGVASVGMYAVPGTFPITVYLPSLSAWLLSLGDGQTTRTSGPFGLLRHMAEIVYGSRGSWPTVVSALISGTASNGIAIGRALSYISLSADAGETAKTARSKINDIRIPIIPL